MQSACDDTAADRLAAKFQQALALHQSGQMANARIAYEEILKADHEHVDALHLLGVMAVQGGDPQRAVELIGRAIQVDSNNAVMHFNQGSALQELGIWVAALASYDRAIAIEPEFAAAWSNRGLVLKEIGALEPALV